MAMARDTQKSQGGDFFFFEGKIKRPPGTYGPNGVLRKAKLASERSGQGDAKMTAEKKLTTPTTPNPTPPTSYQLFGHQTADL